MQLKSSFWRKAAPSLLTLVGLLGVQALNYLPYRIRGEGPLYNILRMLRWRDLGKPKEIDLTNYYERLLDDSARPMPTFVLAAGWWLWGQNWMEHEKHLIEKRPDFLGHSFRPNLRIPSRVGPLFTNSHGMADREYSLAKPPHTRRIAMLGDSALRGYGVPFGKSVEALLEDRLNRAHLDPAIQHFELLNFAVNGYRVTQLLWVATEKASAFHPDVYVLGLSRLHVTRAWGGHVYTLVRNRIDLKYDYLRNLVRQAGVTPGDPELSGRAKLDPYLLPALRWVLLEMRSHAERQGAQFIVILLPVLEDPQRQAKEFSATRNLLAELEIPALDLLDTFDGVRDPEALRIEEGDPHPNQRGQEMIFENLDRKLQANPEIFAKLVGHPPR